MEHCEADLAAGSDRVVVASVKLLTSAGAGVGSAAECAHCLCRRLGLGSQHPHGRSELLLTPVPGNPILSSDICELLYTHDTHTYTQARARGDTHTHTILKYIPKDENNKTQ